MLCRGTRRLPDPDALAKKLISQCARVKDGDIVYEPGSGDGVPIDTR